VKRRVQVIYSGRVQGVGFRYSTRSVACGYEVTGFVRNLPDGRVELVAEGEENEVRAFLEGMDASHLGAYIRGREANWLDAAGEFKSFEIWF
jgi:acylphosphatase